MRLKSICMSVTLLIMLATLLWFATLIMFATPSAVSEQTLTFEDYNQIGSGLSFTLTSNGSVFAVVGTHGAGLWDLKSRTKIGVFQADRLTCQAVSSDAQYLAVGSSDRTVTVWNVKNRAKIARLHPDAFSVVSMAFSSDGKFLATASNSVATLWSVPAFQELGKLNGDRLDFPLIRFSPRDQWLLVCTHGETTANTLSVWEPQSRKLVHRITAQNVDFRFFAVSPDERTIAIGATGVHTTPDAERSLVYLWDTQTWTVRQRFTISFGNPGSIEFLPDGKALAVVSYAPSGNPAEPKGIGAIYFYDPESGRRLGFFVGQFGPILFTPDGKSMVAGHEGALKLFEVAQILKPSAL